MGSLMYLASILLEKCKGATSLSASLIRVWLPEMDEEASKEIFETYSKHKGETNVANKLAEVLYNHLDFLSAHIVAYLVSGVNFKKSLTQDWYIHAEVATEINVKFDRAKSTWNSTNASFVLDLKELLKKNREQKSVCSKCGKEHTGLPTLMMNSDGTVGRLCSKCSKDIIKFTCPICNSSYSEDTSIETADGSHICHSCFTKSFSICEDCGKVHPKDEIILHRLTDGTEIVLCDTCYRSKYKKCDRCGRISVTASLERINGSLYCVNCVSSVLQASNRDGKKSLIHHASNSYEICKSKRAYGVELETSCVRRDEDKVWSRVNDGSISGKEFVSPKLNGDKGFKEIEEFLERIDCDVDSKCGYHVHIGAGDYSVENLLRLVRVSYALQQYFFKLVVPSRNNAHYCRAMDSSFGNIKNLRDLELKLYSSCGKDCSGFKAHKYQNARYSWMNIHSYFFRGTVELRQHQGTLEYNEIVNWISLWSCYLDFIKNCETNILEEIVNNILLSKNNDSIKYFISFISTFAGDSVAKYYKNKIIKYTGITLDNNNPLPIPNTLAKVFKLDIEKDSSHLRDEDSELLQEETSNAVYSQDVANWARISNGTFVTSTSTVSIRDIIGGMA